VEGGEADEVEEDEDVEEAEEEENAEEEDEEVRDDDDKNEEDEKKGVEVERKADSIELVSLKCCESWLSSPIGDSKVPE
jgi:hypothetical protein